jgi:hypothetical protein
MTDGTKLQEITPQLLNKKSLQELREAGVQKQMWKRSWKLQGFRSQHQLVRVGDLRLMQLLSGAGPRALLLLVLLLQKVEQGQQLQLRTGLHPLIQLLHRLMSFGTQL